MSDCLFSSTYRLAAAGWTVCDTCSTGSYINISGVTPAFSIPALIINYECDGWVIARNKDF